MHVEVEEMKQKGTHVSNYQPQEISMLSVLSFNSSVKNTPWCSTR